MEHFLHDRVQHKNRSPHAASVPHPWGERLGAARRVGGPQSNGGIPSAVSALPGSKRKRLLDAVSALVTRPVPPRCSRDAIADP